MRPVTDGDVAAAAAERIISRSSTRRRSSHRRSTTSSTNSIVHPFLLAFTTLLLIYMWRIMQLHERTATTNSSATTSATTSLLQQHHHSHQEGNIITPLIIPAGRRQRQKQQTKTTTASTTTTTDDNNNASSFAACLLVFDDNHWLIEWLAYHYFVLPLRHLIIAVDPRSQTSPDTILHKWKDRIRIQQWNDRDFQFHEGSKERFEAIHKVREYFGNDVQRNQPDLIVHRARQRTFYYKCLQQFQQQTTQKHDYVVLIDTDEFLHINYKTFYKQYMESASTSSKLILPPPTKLLPTNNIQMNSPGSVMNMLQWQAKYAPQNNLTNTACIQIPRIRYGAKDSSRDKVTAKVPVEHFDPFKFQTLRWLKHASPTNFKMNRISKTIINLSRITGAADIQPVDSIHRPLRQQCGHRRLYIQATQQLLQINHYLGSYQQYTYRNDSRIGKERSNTAYLQAKDLDEGTSSDDDDEIRPWLQGFIKQVGIDEAKHLLQGIGVLEK